MLQLLFNGLFNGSVALHDVVVLRDLLANEDLKELAKIDAIIEMEFYGKRKGRGELALYVAISLCRD